MERIKIAETFFEMSLKFLYNAELVTLENLEIMNENASSKSLLNMLDKHKVETHHQISRLKTIFNQLGLEVPSDKAEGIIHKVIEKGKDVVSSTLGTQRVPDFKSKVMQGIVEQGREMLSQFSDPDSKDFALATAGQAVEQFEITCYQTLCLISEKLGYQDITQLLKTSLKEEEKANDALFEVAKEELSYLVEQSKVASS
jgi:ferritin-like metal-binding protein YciE